MLVGLCLGLVKSIGAFVGVPPGRLLLVAGRLQLGCSTSGSLENRTKPSLVKNELSRQRRALGV